MNSGSNPSDYEFLLRTLAEGSPLAKAESLRRLNALVQSDKKQFASYAKRVVLALQELLLDPKEDINLLACTLALEIVNLNPRDIEFYLKSKLLKPTVVNLGDPKPALRKTAHYTLLAYLRTYRSFDDLLEVYSVAGFASPEWQLRQKAINSFQSILVMEMRYLNWSSPEFRKIFEQLLSRLSDDSPFVQKAAEQCLLSLAKSEELRTFSKKLSVGALTQLRLFCEQQVELGHLSEIKLEQKEAKQVKEEKKDSERYMPEPVSPPPQRANPNTLSLLNTDKIDKYRPSRAEERQSLRKAESVIGMGTSQPMMSVRKEREDKGLKRQSSVLLPPISNLGGVGASRQERLEAFLGKKLLEDLRNEKDWKIRLEAVEELLEKFNTIKADMEGQLLTKGLLPVLLRLLGDGNFKVALGGLKLIEEVLHNPQVALQAIAPQLVQRLGDNKVTLRQNIAKLVRSEYQTGQQAIWIDQMLLQLKRQGGMHVREQILNILSKLYDEVVVSYPFEKILESLCPLMEDLKTKIKIKTLDLLALVAIKSQRLDRSKALLASKLNQVYYEMFLEKIGKQVKNQRVSSPIHTDSPERTEKTMRTSMNVVSRKASKIANTTSTSLQRYTPVPTQPDQHNATVRTVFFEPSQPPPDPQPQLTVEVQIEEEAPVRKKPQGRIRRRGGKSVESRLSTTNYSSGQAFPPFGDPAKELKALQIEIKSEDWQVSNEALNKIRRMVLHHAQLLTPAVTKSLLPDLMKQVQSLRSTLSKNAVSAVNEMAARLRRQLDPELQLVFGKLIKRTLDANSFISEQVRRALVTLCSGCSQSRVLSLLTSTHTSRAIPIKTAIAAILEGIAFLPKVYEKELQRVTLILVDFLSEGSLEIRQKSKALLNSLIVSERGAIVAKMIPQEHRHKLKKREETSIVMESSKIQASPQPPKDEVKADPPVEEENAGRKKVKKSKITNFPEEFDQLEQLLEGCESGDWKVRLESMTRISELCGHFPEEMGQHRGGTRVIDVLSKQINDPNSKVAINALKVFESLVGRAPALVETSLSVIMNELFTCFSAGKNEIRALAEQLFVSICGTVEKWMLTQHLCHGALYSVQKSKPLIVEKLAQLVPVLHQLKPAIFAKNVYPTINKLAEENRPELMAPLKLLLQAVYTEVGEDCMAQLKQRAKQLIFE